MLVLTYREVSTRYGLSTSDIRAWLEAGLFEPAPAAAAQAAQAAETEAETETVAVPDPDGLPPLARLHHELGLSAETLDLVAALRRRLLAAQQALAQEQAYSRQLEAFVRGDGRA